MALNLDPRQREMLKEMGITLWLPAAAAPQKAAAPAVPATAPVPVRNAPAPVATTPAPPKAAAPAPAPAPASAAATGGWVLGPICAAYPRALPQPGQPRWLVLVECAQADAPLAGEAGALLDAMLRALRLQHNPQVFIAPLLAAGSAGAAQDLPAALAHTGATLVLALGLPAARLVLGGQAPLGQLRARTHSGPAGVPVVVSYAPHHLLRAPQHKSAAWADLCRAQLLAQSA